MPAIDETKLCILIKENDDIYMWAEPYLIDGELSPSISNRLDDSNFTDPIYINKSDIPDGVGLEFCKYRGGKVLYSEERAEEGLLSNLRSERQQEFQKYDKYQLPYLQESMTDKQKQEYNAWRQAWLDVTITKQKPERPEWFD